jgi:hypothetical protein
MTLERISPAAVTTAAQVSSQLVSMARIMWQLGISLRRAAPAEAYAGQV